MNLKRRHFCCLIIGALFIIFLSLFFLLIPIKEYIEFNHLGYYSNWNTKTYNQVKSFNRIDFGYIGEPGYEFRRFGNEVSETPKLFSSQCLQYLPNTKIWILGAIGEKETAIIMCIKNLNKYANYVNDSGEDFGINFCVTDRFNAALDFSIVAEYVYIAITPTCFNENTLHLRFHLPDMTEYDDFITNLNYAY